MMHSIDKKIKNYVNHDIRRDVSYKIDPEHRQIDFYITHDRKVIIVGTEDNNYVFWLSVSECADRETNKAVFDQIAHEEPEIHTFMYLALERAGYAYDDLNWMYHDRITPAKEVGMVWSTPFGHYYSADQRENNGDFFASDIANLPDALQVRCKMREADGLYLPVLEKYLQILDEDGGDRLYYAKPEIREINGILGQEQYLILSENEKVRNAYHAAILKMAALYNCYMTEVR